MAGYAHRVVDQQRKPGTFGVPQNKELTKMLTMTRDTLILREIQRMIKDNTRRDFPCGTLIPMLTHLIRGEKMDSKCKDLHQNLYPKKDTCTEASTPDTSPTTVKPTPSSPTASAQGTSPTSTKPKTSTKSKTKEPRSSSKPSGLSFAPPAQSKPTEKPKLNIPAKPIAAGLTSTIRPVVRSTPTKLIFTSEDEMLYQMTESTSKQVLEGLKLIRQIKDEHKPKHADLLIEAYEIASLALIEAMDNLKGVRAIEGLSKRASAYEKVKILSARDFKTYIEGGK